MSLFRLKKLFTAACKQYSIPSGSREVLLPTLYLELFDIFISSAFKYCSIPLTKWSKCWIASFTHHAHSRMPNHSWNPCLKLLPKSKKSATMPALWKSRNARSPMSYQCEFLSFAMKYIKYDGSPTSFEANHGNSTVSNRWWPKCRLTPLFSPPLMPP